MHMHMKIHYINYISLYRPLSLSHNFNRTVPLPPAAIGASAPQRVHAPVPHVRHQLGARRIDEQPAFPAPPALVVSQFSYKVRALLRRAVDAVDLLAPAIGRQQLDRKRIVLRARLVVELVALVSVHPHSLIGLVAKLTTGTFPSSSGLS